jgi:hypothetical protein
MRGIDGVARAVRSVFAKQRQQWRALGKERFGDWSATLAEALQEAVAKLYLESARGARAKAEHADSFAMLARRRCLDSARSINATTNDMLAEGRDPWTDDRVAQIAATEGLYAKSAGIVEVAAATGQRLRWVTERSNNPCKFCRSMSGRTVKAGEIFGIHNGVAVYHPPQPHPVCRCKLKVVGDIKPAAPLKPHERPGMVDVSWEEVVGGKL